jgi:tRNA(Ile2) C34 agmatinyltransferase TiaS
MTDPDNTAHHTAYRAGVCVDCRTAPHSAGRPRCNDCHQTYNDNLAKGVAR